MGDKISVLELCTSPGKGGLEMYYADISNQLQPHFKLLNVMASRAKIEERLEQNRPILRLDKKAHYFPILAARKLAKMIDDYAVDVIHLHWNKDLVLAVFAKLMSQRKPKVVITRHMQFPAKKDGFLHRFLYSHIDHIIAITQTMANDLQRFIPQDVQPDISVNYLGIKLFEPAPDDEVQMLRAKYAQRKDTMLIGLFGRIEHYKGHDLMVDAMLLAKKRGLPFLCLMVGHAMDEGYLQRLKQRVADEGLQDYIVFTGFVNQPRALMQACDVLTLTTIEETFGLVLIEAMSVGTTVVGSDRGGVPEIIEHKETGLLFQSENSASLCGALAQLYEQPEQANRLAENALMLVKDKFDAALHVQRLVTCLRELART